MNEINTGGGAAISGKANASRDIIGRDQINVFFSIVNIHVNESRRIGDNIRIIEDQIKIIRPYSDLISYSCNHRFVNNVLPVVEIKSV